jgi:hypothetical protein
MQVGAGDSVGGCDSKMARNNELFPSPVTGSIDELALLVGVGGCKRVSSGVGGLVWARTTLSVCPIRLQAMVMEDVWVEMGSFSPFSCF